MALAPNPAEAVCAWHATPEDRYDFNMDNQRIEVKSTATRMRAHQFSLEQLSPPTGTRVLIASLFVERAGAGKAVADLLSEVRDRVGDRPDLMLHLDRVVGLTLGSNWRHVADARFDRELAESSLAYFSSGDIPTIRLPVPAEVSTVRFTADLTNVSPVDVPRQRGTSGLFAAMLQD